MDGFSGKFNEQTSKSAVTESKGTAGLKPDSKSTGTRPEAPVVGRPAASFNIQSAISQIRKDTPQLEHIIEKHKEEEKISAHTPVTLQKIETAIDHYIKDNNLDKMISIALKTHKPIVEGDKIVLMIDNQLQIEKLQEMHHQFYMFMCRNLENGFLTINYQLFNPQTTQEEKKLFTSAEKFEHFVELNPVVAELKKIFALEIE